MVGPAEATWVEYVLLRSTCGMYSLEELIMKMRV